MNEIVKDKWIKALRSGEYKQGEHYLNNHNKHCCLGVLCDIFSKENKIPWIEGNQAIYGSDPPKKLESDPSLKSLAYLPPFVEEWSGLTDMQQQYKMTDLNDVQNRDFVYIADYIENNF